MSQTLKAGLVRFNRPILIGGSAILGVATSNFLSNATVRSALLAVAALCLMYVGDVGRAVGDRVARLLPSEANKELVKSTQAHNLGSRSRSAGILLVAAVGLMCLAGSLVASTVHDSAGHSSERLRLGIKAPRSYLVKSEPLTVRVQCPFACAAHVSIVGSPLNSFSMPRGNSSIQFSAAILDALLARQDGWWPLRIRVSSNGLAPVESRVLLKRRRSVS